MAKTLYLVGAISLLVLSGIALALAAHNGSLRAISMAGVACSLLLGKQFQKIRVKEIMDARNLAAGSPK